MNFPHLMVSVDFELVIAFFLWEQKMVNKFRYLIFFLTFLTLSCSEKGLIQDNPQESFANAKAFYNAANYELAIKKLSEFKNRYPYSRYALEAELLIADSYFETGKFTEAGVAYEQFVKLHPKHEKIDFALFRVGLSYWKDAPEEIDREQEYTQTAINKWQKLISDFPNSNYAHEASTYIKKGQRRIAEAEDFIARFYCRKEIWHSCAYHSIIILERFPDYKDLVKASVKRAAHALERVAKEEPFEKEKNLFNKDSSQEELLKRAEDLKEKTGI